MKLAVFIPNWVGDACMATPTIRALSRELDPSELCLVGRRAPLMVLEGLPWHHSTLLYKPRSKQQGVFSRRGVARELRRRSFDTVVLLTNSFSTAAMAWLSGAKHRVGYDRNVRRFLLTNPVPMNDSRHETTALPCIDAYLRIAEHLECRNLDRRMELFCTEQDEQVADQLWSFLGFQDSAPTVVLNTGAAIAPTKRWPAEHAAEAASKLVSEFSQLQVLIHCGPGEREEANAIEAMVDNSRVRSMGRYDDLPLGLSKAAIKRSTLVISTDSGPRHIAVAFNKPVVSIFGSIDASLTTTYNMPEQVVWADLDCQPCNKHSCPLKHARCMRDLRASTVLEAAHRIMKLSRKQVA